MKERAGLITVNGNPLTLLGEEVKVGDAAPDFAALDNDMNQVALSDLKGKPVLPRGV